MQRFPPSTATLFSSSCFIPSKPGANLQGLAAAGCGFARRGRAKPVGRPRECAKHLPEDGQLVAEYHSLGGGKWDHLMDQIKIGLHHLATAGQSRPCPPFREVRPHHEPSMAVAIEGSEIACPSYRAGPAILPNWTPTDGRNTLDRRLQSRLKPFHVSRDCESTVAKIHAGDRYGQRNHSRRGRASTGTPFRKAKRNPRLQSKAAPVSTRRFSCPFAKSFFPRMPLDLSRATAPLPSKPRISAGRSTAGKIRGGFSRISAGPWAELPPFRSRRRRSP